LIRRLPGHSENVRCLAWAPDGTRLASGSDDCLARIWDAARGVEQAVLTAHTAPVVAVAWNPDGTRLLTAGREGVVKLWDAQAALELCSLEEHTSQAADAVFSPDGSRIATSDLDGMIYLRDARPGHDHEARRHGSAPVRPVSQRSHDANDLAALVWYRDTAERFRHREQDLHSQRLLVRFLADAPHPTLRDGLRAVELGEEAAARSHRNNAAILDDLAAAYAEAGDFAKAVAVQQEAIALLDSPKDKAALTTRLRLYESRQPTRDHDW
jgi:dipeptidyl aminopeptidase/acylaminoacyl peptidase